MNDLNNGLFAYCELLDTYKEHFGNDIDTVALGDDIERISKIIKDCLASGKPYQSKRPAGAIS